MLQVPLCLLTRLLSTASCIHFFLLNVIVILLKRPLVSLGVVNLLGLGLEISLFSPHFFMIDGFCIILGGEVVFPENFGDVIFLAFCVEIFSLSGSCAFVLDICLSSLVYLEIISLFL